MSPHLNVGYIWWRLHKFWAARRKNFGGKQEIGGGSKKILRVMKNCLCVAKYFQGDGKNLEETKTLGGGGTLAKY